MRAIVVAAFVSLSACSLGALDGFSGGTQAPDPPGADGGSSGGGGEASVDAAVDGDAGTSTFCGALSGPTPKACIDFEDGKVPLGWTLSDTGHVAIEGVGKTGKGLRSTIPASGSTGACLSTTLGTSRRSVVIEGDVRFGAAGGGNYDIFLLNGQNGRELGISVTGTTIYVEEDFDGSGNAGVLKATSGQPKQTFQRIRIAVTVNGTVADTELFVDGVSLSKYAASAELLNDNLDIDVGDCGPTNIAGWEVFFDNVVVYETL